MRDTYPDFVLTVEQQIAEGEWVVSRVTMRGTHLGAWIGMARCPAATAVATIEAQ